MAKGIIVKTTEEIITQDLAEPLHLSLNDAVGGYYEIVRPRYFKPDSKIVFICNENGINEQLDKNLIGSIVYGGLIVGDIVFMKEGMVNGEPDLIGLKEDEISFLTDLFHNMIEFINEFQ